MRPPAAAMGEILLIIGLILSIVWVVKPLGRSDLDLILRLVVAGMLLVSPSLHRDGRHRLGLRLDNFWRALATLLPVSLLAAASSIAAGYLLVSFDPPESVPVEGAYYVVWAGAQQYALQSVVLLRLEDAGLRRSAPPTAALLFSLVHAPNPGLMILTFFGGLLWCSTFRRHPNLAAVTLSHALLAVIVASTLPPQATGNFRIGPAYVELRRSVGSE